MAEFSDCIVSAKISTIYDGPPTRMCMICNKLENEKAHMVRDVGWICPECVKKLRMLIANIKCEYHDTISDYIQRWEDEKHDEHADVTMR